MKIKKVLGKLLIFVLCACMFLLAACNPGDGDSEEPWTTTGELTKDENGNVVFSNVELKLTTVVTGQDKAVLDTQIARFNAEYDGKINIIPSSFDASRFENNVASQITNNSNAPDFMMSHQKANKSFAENGLIQPFDEAMQKSGIKIDMDNFATELAQYSSLGYNGSTYAVPVDAQSFVVFYNKKILSALGKEVPTTRAQLLDVCKTFKENATYGGKSPVAWSTSANYFIEYAFPTAVLQNGGKLYDPTSLRVDWQSNGDNFAAFGNAIAAFRELFDKGYALYNESGSTALSEFLAGQRLFYFTQPWAMKDIVTNYASRLEITEETLMDEYLGGASMAGWFAMTDNPAKNSIYGDAHFFTMSKTVTDINKKAAMVEFIRWFTTNTDAGSKWASAGHFSVSKAINTSDAYSTNPYVTNYISKFYGDINNFQCIGITPFYEAVIPELNGVFTDTVGNRNNPTAASDTSAIKSRQDSVNSKIDFINM